MSSEALMQSVVEQTTVLASWVGDADPALPVPSCPDWTLADLVEHVGATQQWVAALTEGRIIDPQDAFTVAWGKPPSRSADWSDWLQESADRALTAFASAPPDAEVFDPSGSGDGVRFWKRRLHGEVSVHRIDAALTVGRRYELAGPMAGAAIDDWFDTMSSPGWAAHVPGFADAMRGNGQILAWVAPDIDRAWILRRGKTAPLTLTRQAGDVDRDRGCHCAGSRGRAAAAGQPAAPIGRGLSLSGRWRPGRADPPARPHGVDRCLKQSRRRLITRRRGDIAGLSGSSAATPGDPGRW